MWRRRIPFVQQLASTDCGAACLTMVLGYFGRRLSLGQVRRQTGTGRTGADARALVDAARREGLLARGLRVERIEELDSLPPAAILHWDLRHFVVLERMTTRGAVIVDPSFGRRLVGRAELDRSFSGVAIVFEPAADFEPQGADRSSWGRYLRALFQQSGALRRVVVVSFALQLLALILPLLTGLVVDRVVPRADLPLLQLIGVGLVLLAGVQLIAALVRSFTLAWIRVQLDAQLSRHLFEHLVRLPFSYFQERSAGDLMLRLSAGSRIRDLLTSSAVSAALDGTMAGIYLLLVLAVEPRMGLLVLALGLARAGLVWSTRHRRRDLMACELQAESRARSRQLEIVAGIETLKSSGLEERAVKGWSGLLLEMLNVVIARERLGAWLEAVLDTLRLMSPLVVLVYGVARVIDGNLSLGMMLALNSLAIGFFAPLAQLLTQVGQLQLMGGYLDRLDDILEQPGEQDERARLKAGALSGRIALERVDFSYGPRAAKVINGVDIEIAAGSFVALVGRSGAGKSTLARLLLGLYRPTSGRVLFDGMDLASLDLQTVRRQLGIVPQTPAFFAGSVRSNIALVDASAPLARVQEAARIAELHDEIMALPMAYETPIDSQGNGLSGGQRQRLALARALLARPSVLLLDEATSALDGVTELRVQRQLETLPMTRVVIAHRLSTVRRAERILVLDEGRIVEDGRHDELVNRGGVYSVLVASQLEPGNTSAGASLFA